MLYFLPYPGLPHPRIQLVLQLFKPDAVILQMTVSPSSLTHMLCLCVHLLFLMVLGLNFSIRQVCSTPELHLPLDYVLSHIHIYMSKFNTQWEISNQNHKIQYYISHYGKFPLNTFKLSWTTNNWNCSKYIVAEQEAVVNNCLLIWGAS